MNWKEFWQEYPERDGALDLFQQVGKTKFGKAINEEQFDSIVSSIRGHLQLNENDVLLELCCGNGLITERLGQHVKKVIAVDYSRPLIETAIKYSKSKNIEYYEFDVKEINTFSKLEAAPRVTKVLCYEALSFFEESDLHVILRTLKEKTDTEIVFFGSVLDAKKKFNFYNTFMRKLLYYKVKIFGKDFGLGNWWQMSLIEKIASVHEFRSNVLEQSNSLHTAHFRNDIVLKRLNK